MSAAEQPPDLPEGWRRHKGTHEIAYYFQEVKMILKNAKNTVYGSKNLDLTKLCLDPHQTLSHQTLSIELAKTLAGFTQNEAELFKILLQLVCHCKKVDSLDIWNWAGIINNGIRFIPSDFNVTTMSDIFDKQFSPFFVRQKLGTKVFLTATPLGNKTNRALYRWKACSIIPKVLQKLTPADLKDFRRNIMKSVGLKGEPVPFASCLDMVNNARRTQACLRSKVDDFVQKDVPAIIQFVAHVHVTLRIIRNTVMHNLQNPPKCLPPENEVPVKEKGEGKESKNVAVQPKGGKTEKRKPVQSVQPIKLPQPDQSKVTKPVNRLVGNRSSNPTSALGAAPTSTFIRNLGVINVNNTLAENRNRVTSTAINHSPAVVSAPPVMYSSAPVNSTSQNNSYIPSYNVGVAPNVLPSPAGGNVGVGQTSGYSLPPPLISYPPQNYQSEQQRQQQAMANVFHTQPIENNAQEIFPPIPEAPQVPPSPNMVPDAMLEALTAGTVASLGCQEILVTTRLIEDSLVERMRVRRITDIGIANIHAFECVRELEKKQHRVNEIFLSKLAVYSIVTLHEMQSQVLEEFKIRDFRQLGLGPFSVQPIISRHFKQIPLPQDIVEIEVQHVLIELRYYLQSIRGARDANQDEFLQGLKMKYHVEHEGSLGIYIRDFAEAKEMFNFLHWKGKRCGLVSKYEKMRKKNFRKDIEQAMTNLKVALFPLAQNPYPSHTRYGQSHLPILDENLWDMETADLIEEIFKNVEKVSAAVESGHEFFRDWSLKSGSYTTNVLQEFFLHLKEEPWLHELLKLCVCVGKSESDEIMKRFCLDGPDGTEVAGKSQPNVNSLQSIESIAVDVREMYSHVATCYRENIETIMEMIRQCGQQESEEDQVETVEAVLLSHFFDQGVRSVKQLAEVEAQELVELWKKNENLPSKRTSIWYESAICSNSRVVTYKGNVSNLGLGLLGSQEDQEAMNCLLNCPVLEDMAVWSNWGLVFEPEFGKLRGFIKDNMTNIAALEIKPGTLLRLPLDSTLKEFTDAVEKKNVTLSCGHLVGLVVYNQADKMLLDKLAETMLGLLKRMNDLEVAEQTEKMVDAMLEGREVEDSSPGGSKPAVVKFVHRCLMKLPLLMCELVAEKLFLTPLCNILGLSGPECRNHITEMNHTTQDINKLCQLGLVLQYEEWYKMFIQRMETQEMISVDESKIEIDIEAPDDRQADVKESPSLNSRIDHILKIHHTPIKLPVPSAPFEETLTEDKSHLEKPESKPEHEEGELEDSSVGEMSDDDAEGKDCDTTLVDMDLESIVSGGADHSVEKKQVRSKSSDRDVHVIQPAKTVSPLKAEAMFFNDRWKEQSKHTLILALVSIKQRWRESMNYSLKELKSNVQILTNNGFVNPLKSTIHFGPTYGCQIDFQKTFPGVEWNILDACYIEDFLPNSSTRCWKEFFRELGVHDGLALQKKTVEMRREDLECGPLSCSMPYIVSYESTSGTKFDYFRLCDVFCSDIVSLQVDLIKDEYEHMKAFYQILSKDLDTLRQNLTTTLSACDIVDDIDQIYETGIEVETTVCRYLKKLEWVPVKQANFVSFLKGGALVGREANLCAQIKDVYVRIPEVERILAHTVAYLDDELDPDLAVLLGAKSTITYQSVLEHFIGWCCCDEGETSNAEFMTSIQHMKRVYQYFKDHLPEEKLSAFYELPFIFVPDEFSERDHAKVHGKFYRLDQVCIHDPLSILTYYSSVQDSVKLKCLQPLEPHYEELVSFFTDVPGMESMPRLKDYLTVIEAMVGKDDNMNTDIYNIFSIIGDQLSQLQAEELSYVENMLQKFLGSKKMFPTLHDKIVSLEEGPYVCYVGDVPDSLMKTISTMKDIHVIKVENVSDPCVSIDNTKTFMSVCGITDIRDVLFTIVDTDDQLGCIDLSIKKIIDWRATMVTSYLRKYHTEIAEKLEQEKTLPKLQNITYYKVSKLNFVYGLKDRPTYKQVENYVFHHDREKSRVYVVVDNPDVEVEANNFLASFLSFEDDEIAKDIRMFLRDVLPLFEEINGSNINMLTTYTPLFKRKQAIKREGEELEQTNVKKTKRGPGPSLTNIVLKREFVPKDDEKLRHRDNQPEYFTSGKQQSRMPADIVGTPTNMQGSFMSPSSPKSIGLNEIDYYYKSHGVPTTPQSPTPSTAGTTTLNSSSIAGVNSTFDKLGSTLGIFQTDLTKINNNVLKSVLAQLDKKNNSTSASGSCTTVENVSPGFKNSLESESNAISSDMINFVKTQMELNVKDSGKGSPITSHVRSIAISRGTDKDGNADDDPPDEKFLQAQQNIQKMIAGQFSKFSGKS